MDEVPVEGDLGLSLRRQKEERTSGRCWTALRALLTNVSEYPLHMCSIIMVGLPADLNGSRTQGAGKVGVNVDGHDGRRLATYELQGR